MDGINPGRQCQFDIENSNDLHTTTTTTLYMLSRLTSSFFFFLKIVVVVWCCTIHRPRISNGYGNWRRVNSHILDIIHSFYLFTEIYEKGGEKRFFFGFKDFAGTSESPNWGDDVWKKKITAGVEEIAWQVGKCYFRNRYTRRARWNIDNNKKNEEGIYIQLSRLSEEGWIKWEIFVYLFEGDPSP